MVLYEIVTKNLATTSFVPKMLTDVHKTQRMASALMFLQRYHDEGGVRIS